MHGDDVVQNRAASSARVLLVFLSTQRSHCFSLFPFECWVKHAVLVCRLTFLIKAIRLKGRERKAKDRHSHERWQPGCQRDASR